MFSIFNGNNKLLIFNLIIIKLSINDTVGKCEMIAILLSNEYFEEVLDHVSTEFLMC